MNAQETSLIPCMCLAANRIYEVDIWITCLLDFGLHLNGMIGDSLGSLVMLMAVTGGVTTNKQTYRHRIHSSPEDGSVRTMNGNDVFPWIHMENNIAKQSQQHFRIYDVQVKHRIRMIIIFSLSVMFIKMKSKKKTYFRSTQSLNLWSNKNVSHWLLQDILVILIPPYLALNEGLWGYMNSWKRITEAHQPLCNILKWCCSLRSAFLNEIFPLPGLCCISYNLMTLCDTHALIYCRVFPFFSLICQKR